VELGTKGANSREGWSIVDEELEEEEKKGRESPL